MPLPLSWLILPSATFSLLSKVFFISIIVCPISSISFSLLEFTPLKFRYPAFTHAELSIPLLMCTLHINHSHFKPLTDHSNVCVIPAPATDECFFSSDCLLLPFVRSCDRIIFVDCQIWGISNGYWGHRLLNHRKVSRHWLIFAIATGARACNAPSALVVPCLLTLGILR